MTNIKDAGKFKELLNQEYSWPVRYAFKFIVSVGQVKIVEDIFSENVEITKKPSSGGKYVSVTINATMNNADEILAIYKAASAIHGIISL